MDPCETYGKLYAFFLEVCRLYVEGRFNGVFKFDGSNNDEKISTFLKNQIRSKYKEPYKCTIWRFFGRTENEGKGNKEIEQLITHSGQIAVKKLDYVTFLKIIKIIDKQFLKSMSAIKVRNDLCHIEMSKIQGKLSKSEFNEWCDKVRNGFQKLGAHKRLLDTAYKNIFKEELI